ncbi:MAG: thioredoxin reductase [Candidatus Lokiarchaeota archaeon]|nr:thioredoxin reductase [Candidatus Lokiarchaeota archaeon]
MKEEMFDVVIVGAGPAGLTAGIYTERSNLDTLILHGKTLPKLILAHKIENYPGFLGSVIGKELFKIMKEQAESYGSIIRRDNVINLVLKGKAKAVLTGNKIYKAKAVIIATGSGPRRKTFINEDKFIGFGVSYCAKCDGPLFKDRKVIIIGDDDETAEEALDLNNMGVNVSIYTNDKDLNMDSELAEKVKNKGIEINTESKIKEIYGKLGVKGVITEKGEKIELDGVFINYTMPTSSLFKNTGLELEEDKRIKVNTLMETNIEGVFAAGDVIDCYNQVAIAVGTGAAAALSAIKYVRKLD